VPESDFEIDACDLGVEIVDGDLGGSADLLGTDRRARCSCVECCADGVDLDGNGLAEQRAGDRVGHAVVGGVGGVQAAVDASRFGLLMPCE
jgi:hypothetical protein